MNIEDRGSGNEREVKMEEWDEVNIGNETVVMKEECGRACLFSTFLIVVCFHLALQ